MKKNNQKQQDNNLNYLGGGGFGSRPKSLLCSICGREFGTASLEIHQKTCIKKYQNDLINMDPGHRQQMPSTKEVISKLEREKQFRQQQGTKGGNKQLQYISEQPQQVMALVGCRKCGRRFNPDRIRKHESVCIGPEPDVTKIKEQQQQQNQRVARKLRPKKTGKWREQHLEFQQALREMRKVRQQEIAEGKGNPFGQQQYGGYGGSRGNGYGNNYGQSQYQPKKQYGNANYNQQFNYDQPQYKSKPQQQPSYSQSVKVTHKQPNMYQEQKQVAKYQQSPNIQMQQRKGQQQVPKNNYGTYGDKYNDGYGKPPQNQVGGGGGAANYQIANSNVSTFSLFTNDGKPKNYDDYQKNNPYARKNGLY